MSRSKAIKPVVSIVVPTLNEEATVGSTISRIAQLIKKRPEYEWNIVVTDSSSSDATHLIVRGLQKRQKNLYLLVTELPGLGWALFEGKKFAVTSLKSEYIVTLDCDGSHDPQEIIQMLERAKTAELVVGSRYVKNGTIENWSLHRKIFSIVGNLYLKYALGIRGVHDYTSNFRVYSKATVQVLMQESSHLVSDWSYLCVVLMILGRYNMKLVEHPIHFKDRMYGESKLDPMTYISRLLVLGFRQKWQNLAALTTKAKSQ